MGDANNLTRPALCNYLSDIIKQCRIGASAYHFKSLLFVVVLYFTTFCLVLPILCWSLPFSRYYLPSKSPRSLQWSVSDDRVKGRAADDYFRHLDPVEAEAFYSEARQLKKPRLAIGVITVKRQSDTLDNYKPRYLTRVVAQFDKLLKQQNRNDVIFFICNTQPIPMEHREAWNLTKYIHVLDKRLNVEDKMHPYSREQEKLDYAFCINRIQTFRATYSVLVQDDALPYEEFVSSIDRLLDVRLENRIMFGELQPNSEDWTAVKFYYPEKWQGYGCERFLIVELIAGALFGGGVLYGVCRLVFESNSSCLQSHVLFACLCVYSAIVIFTIGRPYMLTLRKLSVDFYALREAPPCCIPAVLYRTERLHAIETHLLNITCSRSNPLDIALSDYMQQQGQKQYLVMPNLFNHIGVISSLHRGVNSVHSFWG